VITKPRERGGSSPRWAAEPQKKKIIIITTTIIIIIIIITAYVRHARHCKMTRHVPVTKENKIILILAAILIQMQLVYISH
jgi:uncharacterized membrane protein YidH (DUF202 family)